MMAITLAACEIETPSNGDLDGLWHLETVDTLTTGGRANLSDCRVFWAVQARLLNVSSENESYYLKFLHKGGMLTVRDAYEDFRQSNDSTYEFLKPYGISALPDTFSVRQLNSNRMVIEKAEGIRLSFTKF